MDKKVVYLLLTKIDKSTKMDLTFYGHSCFSIVVNGKMILFDPFISPNPKASSVDIFSIKPDYILLSHGHEDHVADAESIAKSSDATIISTFEVVTWFQKKGVKKVHPMNHGGNQKFDFGNVKMVNAVHSSSMPDGSYGGHPCGFVIQSSNKTFYYTGDTALTYDMKLIPLEFKIDFALLPIGDNFTMGIDDALIASEFIECSTIFGLHFDTFEVIEIDNNKAIEKAKQKNIDLRLLTIGETIKI